MTVASFALDWSLGGGAPWIFHLTNVLLHALTTALVGALAWRWLGTAAAVAAAIVFAIHPVHAEAVANAVGRSELLAGAAMLLIALLATCARPVGTRRVLTFAALGAFAVGSKEIGAVAPLVAWAAARVTPLTAAPGARATPVRDAVSVALGIVPLLLARVAVLGAITGDRPHPAWAAATAVDRVLLALASVPRAAAAMLAPQQPRIDYSPTLLELRSPDLVLVALGVLLAAVAVLAFAYHMRRPAVPSFAVFFAAVTFLPVSNLFFPSGLIVAERTLYSPSVGVALLFGMAFAALWQRRRVLAAGAAAVWSMPALWLTIAEIPVWKDSATVYETMLARAPTSYKAHFLVGNLRVDAGRLEEATRRYDRGLALFDADPQLLYAAGAHALRRGDSTAAVRLTSRAIEIDARARRARTTLARLLIARNDTARAADVLRAGLALEPDQRVWRELMASLEGKSR